MDETAIYRLFDNHESTEVKEALELLRYYRLANSTTVPTGGRPRMVWMLSVSGDEPCEESEERGSGE
jgi:hypothetical protein